MCVIKGSNGQGLDHINMRSEGQDDVLDAQHQDAPSAPRAGRWRPEYDASRTTEKITLRLAPEDALALRLAARANARSVSAHIAALVRVSGDPVRSRREEDPLAEASSLNAAITQIPNEIRRLRSDLASKGGLVKSLFIRPGERDGLAETHAPRLRGRHSPALRASAESDGSAAVGRDRGAILPTVRVRILKQMVLRLNAHDR